MGARGGVEPSTFRFSGLGTRVRQALPASVTCIAALIRTPLDTNERTRMRPKMSPPGLPLPRRDLRPWWRGAGVGIDRADERGSPVRGRWLLSPPLAFRPKPPIVFSAMRGQRRGSQRLDPWSQPDPPLALALQQLAWYAVHRDWARWGHWVLETLQVLGAAGATLAAGLQAAAWATAVLAAATLVVTGLRQLFHFHENWLAFTVAWAQLHTAINRYRILPEGDERVSAGRTLVDLGELCG